MIHPEHEHLAQAIFREAGLVEFAFVNRLRELEATMAEATMILATFLAHFGGIMADGHLQDTYDWADELGSRIEEAIPLMSQLIQAALHRPDEPRESTP